MANDQRIMYIFPGQGSQYSGMGSDLCRDYSVAREVYAKASEVLGYDLAALCANDSEGQLNLTRFTQPALLTHSIACLEVFKELNEQPITPAVAAGHSLGEYSALVAAGVLDFEDAVRLVQKRGELMGTHGEGEMLAFPLDLDTVRPLAEKHYCGIAACNLKDQTVVGGRAEDLDRVTQEAAERFPRKRAARLKTEGAFHTYYMVTAARHFRSFLDTVPMNPTDVRVLSNYTGGFHEADTDIIKSRLFLQLFHPVLWFSNLQQSLQDGVTTVIEFGGGLGSAPEPENKRPNLEAMIKRVQRGTDYNVRYLAAINCVTLTETSKGINDI